MTKGNRNILFVVSTGAHMPNMFRLAQCLSRCQQVDTTIANFPGDISSPLSIADELGGIQECVWSGSGFITRKEADLQAQRPAESVPSKLLTIRRVFFSSVVLPIVGVTSRTVFYLILGQRLVLHALRRSIGSNVNAKAGKVLRQSILETFCIIKSLMWRLPKISLIRRSYRNVLASQSVMFGLWDDNVVWTGVAKFLTELQPDLIVMPELNWGYGHHMFVMWARNSGTPLLVLPYSMAGRQEWVASFQDFKDCQVKGLFRRLLVKAFPEWETVNNGRRLLLPTRWLISTESSGFSPSIPWVTNSGPDGVVAVDNEFTRLFYSREGVDTSSWYLIGSLAEDQLYRALLKRDVSREKVCARLGLKADLPFILVGLPPDQFSSINGAMLEFSSYKELTSFIVNSVADVAGNTYNVVVALHPRTTRDDVVYLEECGARIADTSIEGILPAAHIYVSVSSATIRWAIACEVPVINFDAYAYGYKDYQDCPGVLDVKNKTEFLELIRTTMRDTQTYKHLVAMQKKDARKLFKIDGRSEARIVQLVGKLVDRCPLG